MIYDVACFCWWKLVIPLLMADLLHVIINIEREIGGLSEIRASGVVHLACFCATASLGAFPVAEAGYTDGQAASFDEPPPPPLATMTRTARRQRFCHAFGPQAAAPLNRNREPERPQCFQDCDECWEDGGRTVRCCYTWGHEWKSNEHLCVDCDKNLPESDNGIDGDGRNPFTYQSSESATSSRSWSPGDEPEDVDSAEEILCAGVSEDDSSSDQQCGNKGPAPGGPLNRRRPAPGFIHICQVFVYNRMVQLARCMSLAV